MNHKLVQLAKTALAHPADGGAGDPEAHLHSLGRGTLRALGGEPVQFLSGGTVLLLPEVERRWAAPPRLTSFTIL